MNIGAFYGLFGTSDIHAKFIQFLRGEFEGNKTIIGLDEPINFRRFLNVDPKDGRT